MQRSYLALWHVTQREHLPNKSPTWKGLQWIPTLGLLSKIDFNMSTAIAQRQRLESKLIRTITHKLYSLSSKESNTEFLEAFIYRLRKT